jgi:hypothetical protein
MTGRAGPGASSAIGLGSYIFSRRITGRYELLRRRLRWPVLIWLRSSGAGRGCPPGTAPAGAGTRARAGRRSPGLPEIVFRTSLSLFFNQVLTLQGSVAPGSGRRCGVRRERDGGWSACMPLQQPVLRRGLLSASGPEYAREYVRSNCPPLAPAAQPRSLRPAAGERGAGCRSAARGGSNA